MQKIKAFTLRFIKPIDIIGVVGLLVMVGFYLYFGLKFKFLYLLDSFWQILAFMLVLAALTFFYSFIKQYIKAKQEKIDLKKCLIKSAERAKVYLIKLVPFFIFIFVYDSLHDITYLINPWYFDDILIKIDRFLLFGHDIAVLVYQLVPAFMEMWLRYAYDSYFLFFLITPLVYVILNKDKELDDMLLAAVIACYLGIIGYVAVPCFGPVVAQRDLFAFDMAPDWLVSAYGQFRDFYHCFPSLHSALTLVWLYFAYKHIRVLFYFYLPVVVSLWIATMYLRWHYLIDVIVGFLIAIAAIYLAPKINQFWHRKRVKHNIIF